MKNKKSTKRALISSILSLALCMTMLIGTTFAWFTDSVTSAGNIIKSGTLDVEMHWADGKTDPLANEDGQWTDASKGPIFDYEKWEPGYTVVRHIKISNVGTLALKYMLNIVAHGEVSKLAEVIDVYYFDPAMQVSERTPLNNVTPMSTLKDALEMVKTTGQGNLNAGETIVLTLALKMQESAGNEYQNMSIGSDFAVQLLATQLTAESDSFDNQYDKESEFVVEVTNAADLEKALAVGGNIKLAADIETTSKLTVPQGITASLDLNGHTITSNFHKDNGAAIMNNGTLTIIDGTITSSADNGGSTVMNKGTLTVNNATLNGAPNANGSWPSYAVNNTGVMTINDSKITSVHGAVSSYGDGAVATLNDVTVDMSGIPGFTSHGLYTYSNGSIIVNGGNIANKATDQNASGGSVINGAVTVNSGIFSGRVENYYGTPVIKGGIFSVKPNAKFIASGYTTLELDGAYVVVTDKTEPVKNGDELKETLSNGKDVILTDDVSMSDAESNGYGATGINIINGQTFDGNGKTLEVTGANGTWDSAINITSGTIKNVTITKGFRGVFVNHKGTTNGPVLLENVIIDGPTYTISCDQGTSNGLTAKKCTLNGWTSYAATIGNVMFEDCNFGEGAGYAFCRPYAPTTFVGCDFAQGYKLDARAAVTFENCTIGGVALTAENLSTLVVSNIANATVK